MRAVTDLLQRWWRQLLFAAWIWTLTGLLPNGRYTAFLRPEFGVVLGLGTVTLLGFFLAGISRTRHRRFGIPQALQMLILILPLAYIWNARGASLGAFAFQNRSLGMPTVDGGRRALSPAGGASPDRSPASESRASNATQTVVRSVTLLDLTYAPRAYEGKRVQLIGMLHGPDPRVAEGFGRDLPLVFRFVISCCAADATPVAALVEGADLLERPDSSWVEVEGTFRTEEVNGSRVPILEDSTIRTIDPPAQPYLY